MFRLELKEFPTHAPINEPKRKSTPSRYKKINGQAIYSGTLNRFGRATMMKYLKEYIKAEMLKQNTPSFYQKCPIKISMDYYSIPNHASVRRLKSGKLSIPEVVLPCKTRFDIDNYSWPWYKAFQDCLTDLDIIPDDAAMYLPETGSCTFHPVANFNERKIVFTIEEKAVFKSEWIKFFGFYQNE